MPKQVLIAVSRNNKRVTYDPVHSHAATHFESATNLKKLVAELVQNMNLTDKNIATHVDMGRIVGTTDVVVVDATDDIVYGIRKNCDADGHVPFTKSREGAPCQYVSVHLVRQPDDTYELSSAWIGTFGDDDEPFPEASDATPNSKAFWSRHAFVYGSQEIQSGTEIAECPW